jgi:hypothetical protein
MCTAETMQKFMVVGIYTKFLTPSKPNIPAMIQNYFPNLLSTWEQYGKEVIFSRNAGSSRCSCLFS